MKGELVVSTSFTGGGKANIPVAPFDFARCVDMLGGDRKVVLGLLQEFLAGLSSQVEAISCALSEVNPEVVRKEAHYIKGGAAVLSAHALMDAAAVLERIGRSGDLAEGEEGLVKLAREVALLLRYCDGLENGAD